MTCIFWSVATQMKGSGSIKTRPSKTEPGAEAWGENFNEINLEIQWSQAMKESQEKTFAPYHGINNLNDKKIPLSFCYSLTEFVLPWCWLFVWLWWVGMVWSRQMHLIFIPFYLKLSHQEAFVTLTQSQSHAELPRQAEWAQQNEESLDKSREDLHLKISCVSVWSKWRLWYFIVNFLFCLGSYKC